MGCSCSVVPQPARPPVPAGKTRICVAGFRASYYTGPARVLASKVARAFPDRFESWFHWTGNSHLFEWAGEFFDKVEFPPELKGHGSSPMVWIETAPQLGDESNPKIFVAPNRVQFIGGMTQLAAWVQKNVLDAKLTPAQNASASVADIAAAVNWGFGSAACCTHGGCCAPWCHDGCHCGCCCGCCQLTGRPEFDPTVGASAYGAAAAGGGAAAQ